MCVLLNKMLTSCMSAHHTGMKIFCIAFNVLVRFKQNFVYKTDQTVVQHFFDAVLITNCFSTKYFFLPYSDIFLPIWRQRFCLHKNVCPIKFPFHWFSYKTTNTPAKKVKIGFSLWRIFAILVFDTYNNDIKFLRNLFDLFL